MKVIVYTILKNEIDNIEPWLENTKQADAVFLLDTGSTDGSWEKLQELSPHWPNIHISQKTYEHFRFDEARNDNLQMVREWAEQYGEEDIICWSIDLDERFTDGWYEKTIKTALEHPLFSQLRYQYANYTSDNKITTARFCMKCHHLNGAFWVSPVHEWQEYPDDSIYTEGQIVIHPTDILVSHYQNLKSDRTQYKELAKKRIEANEFDMVGWKHYLDGCFDNGDSFDTILTTELTMYGKALQCNCYWLDCICGNIASALSDKSFEDTVMWYRRAIAANVSSRRYYLELANYYLYNKFNNPDPDNALRLLEEMEQKANVVQEEFREIDGAHTWYAHEIFGLALCWAGRYEEARYRFIRALEQLEKETYDDEHRIHILKARPRILGYKEFAENKLK